MNRTNLIAPCGLNCGHCRAFLRKRNPCPGCREDDSKKPVTRFRCKIKNCEVYQTGNAKFCFECDYFPCEPLSRLDKRYRLRYHLSVIENLLSVRDTGIQKFMEIEKEKWTCLECEGKICIHTGCCVKCENE